MKKFIIGLLISIAFIIGVVYFVFTSDKALSLTYIRFNINPEFIIGVNDKDKICVYNPLNNDAKIFNLGMFNDETIEDSMDIILKTLKEKNFLNDKKIDITVITKNNDKIDYYYNKFERVINNNDNTISLVNKKASNEELLTYSNEIVYDEKATYDNKFLIQLSDEIDKNIRKYIDSRFNSLNIKNLPLEEQVSIIENKVNENYFNDYKLKDYNLKNNNLKISDKSNYEVIFNYTDLTYNVKLFIQLENSYSKIKNDINYKLIEEYNYEYISGNITNLKNNFYKCNN